MATTDFDPMVVAAGVIAVERCVARRGAVVAKPSALDLSSLATYWAEGVRLVGEDLALQVAADMPPGAMGLWSYGLVTAPTLGEALDTITGTHLGRMFPGLHFRMAAVDRDRVDLRLDSEGDSISMALVEEIVIATIHNHLRLLTVPATVHSIGLRRPAPTNATPWRLFFGAVPRFGWRYSYLRISKSDLSTALRTANSELRAMVQTAAAAPRDDSISGAVRRYVRANLASALDAAEIARALELTGRTLQRRLKDENTSLRDLVAEERIASAREMLEHSSASITEIASAVGFAQQESFSRAFAIATGESPRAYRRRVVGDDG